MSGKALIRFLNRIAILNYQYTARKCSWAKLELFYAETLDIQKDALSRGYIVLGPLSCRSGRSKRLWQLTKAGFQLLDQLKGDYS